MRGAKRKQSETRGPQVASTKRSRREEAGPREEAAARNKSKLLPNGYEVRRLQKDAEEFLNSSPPREAVGRPQKIAVNKPSNASSTPPQSTGKPSKKPKQTSKANAVEKRAAEKAVAQEAAAQSKRSPAETQKRARGRPKETAQEDQLFVQQDEAEPDDVVIDEDGEEEEVNEVPEPDENDGSEAEEEVSAEDAQQLCGQYGFVVQIRNVINTDTYRTKPRTKSVKDLYFKCKEIESQLDILKEDPQDPAQFDESWTAVRNGLTELRGLTAKVNPDTEKWPTQSIRDIYQAAFPSLVCVFSAYCKFLLSPASGELDPGAYAQAINIINITTGLRDRAIGPNGWKTRPDPSDALARPIVNDVIRPLKDIRVAFRREIASLQQQAKRREEGRRRREELERLEAQMTQQERDSERKTDQLNRLRELFLVRQEVEPDPKARRLLGEPGFRGSGLDNKENVPGTAATRRGPMVLQDRVEAFKTRRDALGRQMREWSAEQRGSLLEGLRRFQGTFSSLCKISNTFS